ncbi:AAA family ATPase [Campylobacter pinnipediorum subsp. caledonicus]|uniref:ATP-dependent DNA helicase n=1 Tax=Campylobacter pinnipediorum TaxID=1965231 RepID=UPI000995A9CC|nr:AAA family ATPase [Campylobacter pinnipediorum]OPA70584.1 AAA family ATPase [Campylobacter pinnipediorum subsp. caledonicus]
MLEQVLNLLKEHNVFLTGGGGVGKTYLTQAIVDHYNSLSKNVIKLGSTGISAVNIGGVSIHSFFKFGICKDFLELAAYDRRQKQKLKKVYDMLDVADLIVIDEISMVSSELMEMIRFRLDVSKFKGKLLIVGDFYQLPPVQNTKNETQTNLFNFVYAFNSSSWSGFEFKNIELKISKRTQDKEFYNILKKIRVGEIDNYVFEYINSLRVNQYFLDENITMLFGRNKDVNEVNEVMLNRLQTPMQTSLADVKILDESVHEKSVQSWVDALNSPKELQLKIGAKIIFIVNYPFMGYYNGEQGKIIDIKNENGVLSVFVQKENGEILEVQKHIFTYTKFVKDGDNIQQQVLATFEQFPFKLAYALTIHKSQGMSINNLMCDLSHIFTNGQLYVALSRAINPKNLKLFYGKSLNFNSYLKSVVKIDKEVADFYAKTKFEMIEEV